MRSRSTATKSSPHSSQLEQASVHQRRPSATENKIDKLFLKSLIGYLKKEECSHTLFSPPTHSDSLQPSFYPHLPTKISLTLVTNNLHIGKPFGHFPVSILLALSGIYDSVGHPFPLEILSLVFCGTTLSWLISHHCPCSSFSCCTTRQGTPITSITQCFLGLFPLWAPSCGTGGLFPAASGTWRKRLTGRAPVSPLHTTRGQLRGRNGGEAASSAPLAPSCSPHLSPSVEQL